VLLLLPFHTLVGGQLEPGACRCWWKATAAGQRRLCAPHRKARARIAAASQHYMPSLRWRRWQPPTTRGPKHEHSTGSREQLPTPSCHQHEHARPCPTPACTPAGAALAAAAASSSARRSRRLPTHMPMAQSCARHRVPAFMAASGLLRVVPANVCQGALPPPRRRQWVGGCTPTSRLPAGRQLQQAAVR